VHKTPQAIFLGLLVLVCLYTLYDTWDLAFLGKVFPVAVALITLALLAAAMFLFSLKRPNYVFFDSEREWISEDKPVHSDLHFQAWILVLLALTAAFGFILGVLAYITMFLKLKAQARWHTALLGALGAVAVLSAFGHLLALEYPRGLLQTVTTLPWPLD
jgi:putative tricarboxylic transport membrane protein